MEIHPVLRGRLQDAMSLLMPKTFFFRKCRVLAGESISRKSWTHECCNLTLPLRSERLI